MNAAVTVVVPTFNSSRTILRCLESVRRQSYPNLELIVVDAFSSDNTTEISRSFGKVLSADTGAARARLIGAEAASGEYILILDSDQILSAHAVKDALATCMPAVAFGEVSTGRGLVARINGLDKLAMSRAWRQNLDPVSGFVRPRFYRRNDLIAAFHMIPDSLLDIRPCPFSDDSLIFMHSGLAPDQVGFVPGGIVHEEMTALMPYLGKWRVYGRTAKPYRGTPYAVLVTSRGRRKARGVWRLASMPGLVLRAIPFFVGYYLE